MSCSPVQIPIILSNLILVPYYGRRNLDMGHVKELADSIRELGLLNPLTIDKENFLIAGLHRLEAVKTLG